LLGQALWDENQFDETENLLFRCQQYCNEFTEWKINCANVLFVKERFHEASTLYEDIISACSSKLLALPAAVLANQCVSLIMCDRNNEAEGLLESVLEAEDEQQDNEQCHHHSTVINLVIGHLYCSKKNFGFGMDRIFAALSDLSKVQSETWYYFKTSFMSMLACIVSDEATEFVSDCLIGESVEFLDKVCTIDRKLKAHTGAYIRNEALYMRDLFNQAVY
jgi:tetratricopeptide repeat protein 30